MAHENARAYAIKQLENDCYNADTEADHSRADRILCDLLEDLGCKDVVEA